MSKKTNASAMKIYFGPNKSKAKLVTLKELIAYTMNLRNKRSIVREDRFDDDSSSWLDVRQITDEGATDVTLAFDPDGDSTITEISVYQSKWKLDEENMKKLI
jgi:hypothetical protein